MKYPGLLLVCLTSLSCGGRDAPGDAETTAVRDSAGVRIVETTLSSRVPAPASFSREPTFAVGETEGDPRYLLSRVVGATQLPEGDVLVANGGSNELRVYDAQGRFVRSQGREGQGPGEFEYLRALGHCRGSGFVAFDLNWQMNAYDSVGNFIDRTVLRAPDGITPYNLACNRRGQLLVLGWGRAATEGPRIGFYEARDHLVLGLADGTVETDFGERLVSERIGSLHGSRPHPAGRATHFALTDTLAYVGSGERFEVQVYGLDGTLHRVLRGPAIALDVTDSVKDAYLESVLANLPTERKPAVRAEVAEWDWPDALPAFTELIVDPVGTAWVQAYRSSPEEPETWSLFDLHAGYRGDIALGWRQTLLEAGVDHILVLQRDSLDVEKVLRFSLDRAGGE